MLIIKLIANVMIPTGWLLPPYVNRRDSLVEACDQDMAAITLFVHQLCEGSAAFTGHIRAFPLEAAPF